MAFQLNSVTLSGNLTRDPERRELPSGGAVVKFSIAHNERVKRGEQWEDETSFFDCVAFGRWAETFAGDLSKGDPVAVVGRLKWRAWETQDGHKRSAVEVIVDHGVRGAKAPARQPQQQGYQSAPAGGGYAASGFGDGNNDGGIPF